MSCDPERDEKASCNSKYDERPKSGEVVVVVEDREVSINNNKQ